jgi:hypothetical protein
LISIAAEHWKQLRLTELGGKQTGTDEQRTGSKRLANTSLECDRSVRAKGNSGEQVSRQTTRLEFEDESNMEEVDETDGPEGSVGLAGASHHISTEEEEVSPEEQGDGAEREADAQEEIDDGPVDEESVDDRGVEEEYQPGAGTDAEEESDSEWKDRRKREWSPQLLS